jgi:hypothetical protein
LFVHAHGNKYLKSANTSELYLVTGDHKRFQCMNTIFYLKGSIWDPLLLLN